MIYIIIDGKNSTLKGYSTLISDSLFCFEKN